MGILDLLFGKKLKRKTISTETRGLVKSEWEKIDTLLKGGKPSQLRQALISADKTVDNCLRDLVDGTKMGERLKNAKELFEWSTYDKIWKAHKIRNKLVHESGFEPPYHVLIKSNKEFKKRN